MVMGDLERVACEMSLQKLIVEYDCKILLFLSDHHRGTYSTFFPNPTPWNKSWVWYMAPVKESFEKDKDIRDKISQSIFFMEIKY